MNDIAENSKEQKLIISIFEFIKNGVSYRTMSTPTLTDLIDRIYAYFTNSEFSREHLILKPSLPPNWSIG